MDQTALLKEQFAGGSKLVEKLRARGFDLVAACWAKPANRARWYLYLVVPAAGAAEQRKAYMDVNSALDELEDEWASAFERVEWSAVQILPADDPFAQGLLADSPAALGRWSMWHGERMIGDTFVEGAYIYAPSLFSKPAPATGN